MFTQSADHDNENLNQQQIRTTLQSQQDKHQPRREEIQTQQIKYNHSNIEPPKQTQTSSSGSCHGYETSSSSSSSNYPTTNTTTSNKSSLSSPPPPPPAAPEVQTIQPSPSDHHHNIQSHENSSLSSSSTTSPNSTDNLYIHNRFLATTTTTTTPKADIENSDEQQQCSSGRQTLAGSSSDAHHQSQSSASSSLSSAQIAQQRHYHLRHHNQSQSQMLKWQGNDVTTPIKQVSTTNVNQGALFSNLDNASTLAKPFQEEQLTTLQAAIRAMSWNSLRHDHPYRVRHNSFGGGQDYYRHLYQQRRYQSQQQGIEAGYIQDNHATKMMKLDGSVTSSIPKQQQQQHQQYPHYGGGASGAGSGHLRARSNQQIRYQHQPIRLNNSKEFKENCTDELLKYGGKKEVKDGHQHLVKTISDLPIFVTIEDFRVASYNIAGEPHLCLPQLLQFLRQHFDTKTMVDKFEESLIHFPSANPKQIEGFIKSSCLPPSAKSCPLIKRSDADKICLSLFEELPNATVIKPPSDIVSLCSKQQQPLKNHEKHSDILNKNDNIEEGSNCGVSPPKKIESSEQSLIKDQTNTSSETTSTYKAILSATNSAPQSSLEKNVLQENHHTSVIVASYSDDKYATVKKKLKCNIDESDTTKSDSSSTQDASEDTSRDGDKIELPHDKTSPPISGDDVDVKEQAQKEELRPESGYIGDTLFETEAQSSILNFARAITSTLMIRVYHKCFGKCIGLFYPALLKNKQLECVQCTICKVMLTPRRFVGHTHGSKENDVCHWGFNSYNWRSYIRLSKKQPTNNLDEDELLHQFNTLSTSAHEQTHRPPPPTQAPIGQSVSSEKSTNFGEPCFPTTSAALEEHNYKQNFIQTKNVDSPTRIAKSDRHHTPGSYASTLSDESIPQPSASNNFAPLRHNTSISMMGRYNTTDDSSSLTLHAPSSSITSLSAAPQLECTSPYVSRHASTSMDDRGSIRSARSTSLSGRMPPSACCSGGGMGISAHARSIPQHSSTDHYGLTGNPMNTYPQSTAGTMAPGLFSQPNQLTDLRNFLLHNWSSTQTGSHPHSQPPPPQPPPHPHPPVAAATLSMLPLAPLGLPTTSCKPLAPPMEVARPTRSTNEDLTKHLSLSAESKRELYVCTNLSTYLSRRGLSAGMTGDIVEKVLNLMRESRLTL